MSINLNAKINQLIDNIAQDFEVSKLSNSPARFNLAKLEWFNKEYFKNMKLVEFVSRYGDYKLQKSWKMQGVENPVFRVADYVLFVDLEKQLVFCNRSYFPDVKEERNYLIGGGRDEGEDGISCLIRETKEESGLDLDREKILKICDFRLISPQKFTKEKEYDGKEMHIYFYPLKEEELKPFVLEESGSWQFEWINLVDYLASDNFLTYSVWRDFCRKNNLGLLEPSEEILTQYLAFILEKNRITKFSDVGSESSCINNWQLPEPEILVWKKNDLKTSLANLNEIWTDVLNLFYNKESRQQQKLLFSAIKDLLIDDVDPKINSEHTKMQALFESSVNYWEQSLKMWLRDNQKDTGSYLWPLRVALSGNKKSPSPFEILSILSKEQATNRINSVLNIQS
jgi:glutamyl/glutaminyl-tRNA synthetase